MFVPLMVDRIIRRAEKLYGDKVAVVDGEKRFTYAAYAERINRLANALSGLGLGPRQVASVYCYNTHHLLEAYYGIPQLGAILSPINIRFRSDEIAYVLNDSGAKVLFFHADFKEVVEEIKQRVPGVKHFVILDAETGGDSYLEYEALLAAAPSREPAPPPVQETDVAELFYTSGTTGHPKGVTIAHRGLCLHALGVLAHYHYDDSDVQLHAIPLFHVNGWGSPQFLTWVGGTHVMLKSFEPARVLQLIETEKVTRMFLVPTMLNMLLNEPRFEEFDLGSLRLILIGGAPTVKEKVKEAQEKFGCKTVSAYGMTETTPVILNSLPKSHKHITADDRLVYQSKTGLDMIGVETRVVDASGKDVARNGKEAGEILVRANSVFEEYWNLPEETARSIVDGWFHTGDMAIIDEDCYVTIVDRKKDVIISGGENIASVEVENTLNSHPAVLETAVIGIPDDKWGEVPKAYVVLRPGQTVDERELIAHCKKKIAGYKAPRLVEFVVELPKSGTGKIAKRELRERYWQGRGRKV